MTVKETEVIDAFISMGKCFLKANKHFHLEPTLARDIIQAIQQLEKENAELKEKLKNEIAFNAQSETVKKYKEQIEKMKCCQNCIHHVVGKDCNELCFEKFEKWKLYDKTN